MNFEEDDNDRLARRTSDGTKATALVVSNATVSGVRAEVTKRKDGDTRHKATRQHAGQGQPGDATSPSPAAVGRPAPLSSTLPCPLDEGNFSIPDGTTAPAVAARSPPAESPSSSAASSRAVPTAGVPMRRIAIGNRSRPRRSRHPLRAHADSTRLQGRYYQFRCRREKPFYDWIAQLRR